MPEQLWFTEILNKLFGGLVLTLLNALHITPKYPEAPIPNNVSMQILVFLFLVVIFICLMGRLSVDPPGGLQIIFGGVHGFRQSQIPETVGPHRERYTPF